MLGVLLAMLAGGCANPVVVRQVDPVSSLDRDVEKQLAAAYASIRRSGTSSEQLRDAVDDYNIALAALLAKPDALVELTPDGTGVGSSKDFERLLVSERLSITGLRNRHRRAGIGVALVGFNANHQVSPIEEFLPPEGITRPVSAVATFDADESLLLELFDSTAAVAVTLNGHALPLAADFTAPYAYLIARTKFSQTRLTATLDASVYDERTGVYLLEDYDPSKIPVLMVHGLLSSPLTWREMTNDLFGDATVRRRYQVWHYVFPTGIPYLHSAATFREDLARTLAFFDPEGDDCATRNLVVLAHSKGGLLAKTLVADSGTYLWDTAFTVPPEALASTPADTARMRRALFFAHDRRVRRVVFIAVPHRGSAKADNPLARIAAAQVQLPADEAAAFERVLAQNREVLQPRMESRLRSGLPSGPAALSEHDPFLPVLADLRVHPSIAFHTIVGEVAEGRGTDGIVTHASAYQAGAESELVVTGARHDVHVHEETVQEVKRILDIHAAGATDAACAPPI